MIRELITEYEALQQALQAAGRRPWRLHEFLSANQVETLPQTGADDLDLSEVYLRLDGWHENPNKPDVWVP